MVFSAFGELWISPLYTFFYARLETGRIM